MRRRLHFARHCQSAGFGEATMSTAWAMKYCATWKSAPVNSREGYREPPYVLGADGFRAVHEHAFDPLVHVAPALR